MTRHQIEGAILEMGQCFIECGAEILREVEPILVRHARAEFEPGTFVHVWGSRIASSWPDGDNVIVVGTVVFSAPGWEGPLTHVEVISGEKSRQYEPLVERDEFPPALAWPSPHFLRARADRDDNVKFLRSMNHPLVASGPPRRESHPEAVV